MKQLIGIALVILFAPVLAFAGSGSCASEAKAVTDMRFDGAYEKSKMVIQLQERENIKNIARRIASSKVVTDEDMAKLKSAMASAEDSRKELFTYTKRIRSDYYTQMYQRCSGRPSQLDDSMNVSLKPDTSYVPPAQPIMTRKKASASAAGMKIRLKRTASAR